MGQPAEKNALIRELCAIPNVGPATAADLVRLGVRSTADLARRDPRTMYDNLVRLDGAPHDICLLDVFESAVEYAGTGRSRPWWEYSRRRKAAAKTGSQSPDRKR